MVIIFRIFFAFALWGIAADAWAACAAINTVTASKALGVSFMDARTSTADFIGAGEGVLVYDATAKSLKLCDDISWVSIMPYQAKGATGQIQYSDGSGNIAASRSLRWTAGTLHVGGSVAPLRLIGTDHAYAEWYPRGEAEGRKAFIGFPSAGNVGFYIQNLDTGLIRLATASGTLDVGGVAATLDVNGFMRLARNSAQPVACDASRRGAVALTSQTRMCVCTDAGWRLVNTDTVCSW